MKKNRAKRKADRAAAYDVICEWLGIAAGFPLTVGFIWLSEDIGHAAAYFGGALLVGLSAYAFHRAADALYTEAVMTNVVSPELIRAVGASLREKEKDRRAVEGRRRSGMNMGCDHYITNRSESKGGK